MGRYEPLATYLEAQQGDVVPMRFAEIEAVLGYSLPRSAHAHRAFWSNNGSNNVMTRAWLAVGFRTEQVDLESQSLVFRRIGRKPSVHGLQEAPTAFPMDDAAETPVLFGWMKGTVTFHPDVDLTEPADPDWNDSTEVDAASS